MIVINIQLSNAKVTMTSKGSGICQLNGKLESYAPKGVES